MSSNLGSYLPVVIVAITWLLGAKATRGVKRTMSQAAPPPIDETERTRRVREEVQRKIAERRRDAAASRPESQPAPPVAATRPAPPADEEDEAEAALQRQQSLAAQVRALEESRPAAQVRTRALASFAAPNGPAGLSPQDWLQELRDPRSVRRAIILREILGEPAAFRGSRRAS